MKNKFYKVETRQQKKHQQSVKLKHTALSNVNFVAIFMEEVQISVTSNQETATF